MYGKAMSYIFMAAEKGDIYYIENLVSVGRFMKKYNVLNDYKDDGGNSVLFLAARGGHERLVLRVLELGALIDMKNTEGQTALQVACSRGHKDVVHVLLKRGADIECVDANGNTALHTACSQGDDKLVEILLIQGAIKIINKKNCKEETAFQLALRERHVNVMEVLLKKGADVHCVGKSGNTTLHTACEWNNHKLVEMLLQHEERKFKKEKALQLFCQEERVNVVSTAMLEKSELLGMDCVNDIGNTVLHTACQQGDDKLVEILFNHGAKKLICKANFNGETALHYACQQTYSGIVKLLVENGADVNCVDKNQNTVLHIACDCGNSEIVKMLLEADTKKIINWTNVYKSTALHVACCKGHVKVVRMLLEKGADIYSVNRSGNTALHLACSRVTYNYEVVQTLLSQGANKYFTAPNAMGETALHMACKQGHVRIVQIMLQRGADIHCVNRCNGDTMMHIACKINDYKMVKMLLDHGADIDLMNYRDVLKPLDVIFSPISVELVDVILSKIPNMVDSLDSKGWSLLHRASIESNSRLASYLLHRGANINLAAEVSGSTPLHLALMFKSFNLVEILMNSGARLNIKDKNGNTPLHVALTPSFGNRPMDPEEKKVLKMMILKGACVQEKNRNNLTACDICNNKERIDLLNNCIIELAKMKSLKVCNSFFLQTVLSNVQNPFYLKNRSIRNGISEFLHSPSAGCQFPLYIDTLISIFDKSKRRITLLKKASKILPAAIKKQYWDRLPVEIKECVLVYLTDEELDVFVTSGKVD